MDYFFPNGKSKMGKKKDFVFNMSDFQQITLDELITVGEIFEITKLSKLRFHLTTKKKPSVSESDESSSDEELPKPNISVENENSESTCSLAIKVPLSTMSSATESATSTPIEPSSSSTQITMHCEGTTSEQMLSSVNSPIAQSTIGITSISFEPSSSSSPINMQVPACESIAPTLILSQGDFNTVEARVLLDQSIWEDSFGEVQICNPRENLVKLHRGQVFKELIQYFKQDMNIAKDVFVFNMLLPNGVEEVAEDSGGVMRDALTEFWQSFYEECTVGFDIKVPFIRHNMTREDWISISKVLMLGWKTHKYFPISLSPGFIACCLYGIDTFAYSQEKLIDEYMGFLSPSERNILKSAMLDFVSVEQDELLEVLSYHDCRVKPTKGNIKEVIGQIAHKEIIQQPMYVKECWYDGIQNCGISDRPDLDTLYEKLKPSVSKVLSVLEFPQNMSGQEMTVASYLKRYIREVNDQTLKVFLRFCTSSDLLLIDFSGNYYPISIRFVDLTGALRRPVAHTCGRVVEIPINYDSYPDFRSEYNSVLQSNIWVMDIV